MLCRYSGVICKEGTRAAGEGRRLTGDRGGTGQPRPSPRRLSARAGMTLGCNVGALGSYSTTNALLNVENLGRFSVLQ